MSKLAIIGSRSFSNQALAEQAFKQYCCVYTENPLRRPQYQEHISRFDEIVSGGARGADLVGAEIGRKWGLKLTEFIPDWDGLGKKAGFIRNEDIVKAADVILAFWGIDPKTGELSRGTQNSLSIAKRLKKTTIIVYV